VHDARSDWIGAVARTELIVVFEAEVVSHLVSHRRCRSYWHWEGILYTTADTCGTFLLATVCCYCYLPQRGTSYGLCVRL